MKKEEKEAWYVMRATYRREMEAKRLLDEEAIENFIPLQYRVRLIRGREVRELVPVVRNLMFVHSTLTEIKRIKERILYLQYMTDSRSGQKIIVPDGQMQRFITVASSYNERLLYFTPEEINLTKGTKVRVTGGIFEGQEGVFVKVKGSRNKRVVIAIQGVIAVAMATIHPDLIEKITEE